ncbi:MAG: sugar phosphate isomerase/epimerase, partial [Victivallales bacterium]|nr:sugar phosphate isomerase/epimerase [Victivallales bacterium]
NPTKNMKPLTYSFSFDQTTDAMRRFIMEEFASNGAKHLVLSGYMLGEIMAKPHQADVYSKELAAAGLSFMDSHSIYGPYADLFQPDGPIRERMLAMHEYSLRIAGDLGIGTMAFHVGDRYEHTEHCSLDALHDNLLRSIESLLPIAEKCGVAMAIENTYYPSNSCGRLLDAVRRFESPWLGVCFDVGHANVLRSENKGKNNPVLKYAFENVNEEPWEDSFLEKVHKYVICTHVHDNDGTRDGHVMPGDGTVDWKNVVPLLKSAPRLESYQCESINLREHISIARMCREFPLLFK